MNAEEVSEALAAYKQKQKAQKRSLILTVLAVTFLVLLVVVFSLLRAHRSEQSASESTLAANSAISKLTNAAADTLTSIQSLDAQSRTLSHGEEPAAYLWRGGLHTAVNDRSTLTQLAALLNQRRFRIGDSGPWLGDSAPLTEYVCTHLWIVIAESVPTNRSQQFLADQVSRDPRYVVAQTAVGTVRPDQAAIIVGFFLTHSDANALARELGVPASSVRPWNFGRFQPSCPGGPS